MNSLRDLKAGDRVARWFSERALRPAMVLTISSVEEDLIRCGPWSFDRDTGSEVDDGLAWGPAYGRTGSYITPAPTEREDGERVP